jgi:hypothetical protein
MGDPFLRAYMTIFDIQNKKMGFVGSNYALPTKNKRSWILPVGIIGGVIGLGLVIAFVVC